MRGFFIAVGLVAGLLGPSFTSAADSTTERYLKWISYVDTQRVNMAEAIRREVAAPSRHRQQSAQKCARAMQIFTSNIKRTKPPAPTSCNELDRLYELALRLGYDNTKAVAPYNLDPRAYGQDAKVMAGLKEERKDLEGALREADSVDPQHKGRISTMTAVPFPDEH